MAETSKTVHQALLVLESLSEESPANPTDLARRLGLSRTVILRLLTTLEQHDYVRRTGSGFGLGFGVLAAATSLEADLRGAARPALTSLVDRFDETAVLSVREGRDVVAIDQVVAADRVVQVKYRVGSRHGLGQAAHGLCLLAFGDEPGEGSHLKSVRSAGYATSHDELEAGVSGLAAPIFDAAGGTMAAIGVVAPTARMPAEGDLAAAVLSAATSVSQTLSSMPTKDPARTGS